MEAYFEPKFSLLADEMKLIQKKPVPAEAVTTIEGRADVLEAVARRHFQDIEKLKKPVSKHGSSRNLKVWICAWDCFFAYVRLLTTPAFFAITR